MPSACVSLLAGSRRLSCAAALALGLCAGAAAAQDAPAQVQQIRQAVVIASDAPRFPDGAAVMEQPLPDDWSQSRPGYEGTVWYQVSFDAPATSDAEAVLALYVERVCASLEVHLNGRRIYGGGRLNEPLAQGCYEPRLVTLPPALLQPQGNRLDLRVSGNALDHVSSRERAAGLSTLRIGPVTELAGIWRTQQFWNVTSAQGVAVALLVLGVFMLGVGWFNRTAGYLLYLGLLAIGWAVFSARIWVGDSPVSSSTAEFLVCLGLAPVVGLAVAFLLRYAQVQRRLVDLLLLAQCVLLPVSVAMAGAANLYAAMTVWYWLLGLEVLAAMVVYLRVAWGKQRSEFWVMGASLVLLGLLLALEVVLTGGAGSIWRGHVLRYALPMLVLVVSFRLVQVFARTLRAAEAGRTTLESRVREATLEIERNFAQLAELRVEQVTERERKRIAADLHDDLGAKLLTIVHTSESDRISTLAREALEEMRLSVRGLTGKPMRVADALADWRAETVSRLGQAGIEADWSGPAEEVRQVMSARAYVQTTRILREAVNNIIKHSGASHCKVRCSIADHEIGVVVQDNGRGIPLELDGRLDRGHGMSSMKHRAKQMQGQCLVESGPGYGTVIRLTLPL
jgi:two-component system, NarL family, sensor histidine kinase UhpB